MIEGRVGIKHSTWISEKKTINTAEVQGPQQYANTS